MHCHLFLTLYTSFLPLIIGIVTLGFTCGILGTILFLRKESMVGDAVSHALFPGITTTFLLTHSRSPLLLFLGGMISGGIALFLMILITEKTKIKKETILGILLSVFFGFGFIIHSIIQKQQIEYQAIINKFLFGNTATLLFNEVIFIVIASVILLSLFLLNWRTITILLFDRIYAHSCGYKLTLCDIFLFSLLVPIITLGLHIMGVILTGTLLIAPAAIARQWTQSMRSFVLIAGITGAFSAFCGTIISASFENMPTGPVIVVVMSIFLLFSLIYNSNQIRRS